MRGIAAGVLTFIRIVMVAIATFVFGLSALLSLIFYRSGRAYHWVGRVWARVVLFICSTRVKVCGLENIKDHIKQNKNFIYVSNHASMFDIPAVMAGIPDQIRIIYKRELEKIPYFGWVLKGGPYITVDRGRGFKARESLEKATQKIKRGMSVLLFAEGTRSRDGQLLPFKRGAFNLAVKTGIPIVPLTINGSYERRPKGSFLIKPGVIELILDSPIPTDNGDGRDYEISLMNRVYEVIRSRFAQPAGTE